MSEDREQKKLVRLIRQIVREEVYAVLDWHLSDYEHKEKQPEEADLQ